MSEETTPSPVPVAPAAPAATPVAPATPAADAPWHSGIFTPEGTFVDQWQNKLPADFEEDRALLANYKDLKGLTKSLKENMTAARAKPAGLVIPPADAPPEEQAKFQSELKKLYGVPDSPEAYVLNKPENLPAGVEWSDDLAKGFQSKAAELGLTPAQAQALVQYDFERLQTAQAGQQQEMEKVQGHERAEMAKRWGDKVDQTLLQASRLAATLSLPNARELFDPKHPLFAGVDMAEAFSTLAGRLGEKQLVSGAAVNNMDPQTMANDIVSNPSNPEYAAFRDSSHPNSAAVRAKVDNLFKQASK